MGHGGRYALPQRAMKIDAGHDLVLGDLSNS